MIQQGIGLFVWQAVKTLALFAASFLLVAEVEVLLSDKPDFTLLSRYFGFYLAMFLAIQLAKITAVSYGVSLGPYPKNPHLLKLKLGLVYVVIFFSAFPGILWVYTKLFSGTAAEIFAKLFS